MTICNPENLKVGEIYQLEDPSAALSGQYKFLSIESCSVCGERTIRLEHLPSRKAVEIKKTVFLLLGCSLSPQG